MSDMALLRIGILAAGLLLIAAIFLASYAYARRLGPAPDTGEEDAADELLKGG
jgi:hypothetical protein